MLVALINTNRMRPPIAPIGLEYVAETVHAAGHDVAVLDLCWEADWRAAIGAFLAEQCPGLVGVSLRNTDDCGVLSRQSFLPDFVAMIAEVRDHTAAPIVVGGVGFSVMPEKVLQLAGADAGVWGAGEFTFAEFANCVERGDSWLDLPNLVVCRDGVWCRNETVFLDPADLPVMTRRWVDNPRYFREGGQAGFETKRGCPGQCIYCADPVAKGRTSRLRPAGAVADEIENLLAMGIDHLHTCDGEFNIPAAHAALVCEELVRRSLGDRLRWYAYCAPAPFSSELAGLMRKAGCVGINFGVDNGDARMLRRLKRGYGPDDIIAAAAYCREAGITVMFDLLLGSPGESPESLVRTIDVMKASGADRIGVSVGVQVYPGTELAETVEQAHLRGGLLPDSDPFLPPAFIEPAIASSAYRILDEAIAGDERFLFFDPRRPEKNYNYNANQRLVDAMGAGHRGAYWDILRRI